MARQSNGEDSDNNVPESEDKDEVQENNNHNPSEEEEDKKELVEGAGLSYADEDSDKEPAARHGSFTGTLEVSCSSSPCSSCGVLPFAPQTSTHHKPMHVHLTEVFKENLTVAPASHCTAKWKYLNE
jgi:hypothetical protein